MAINRSSISAQSLAENTDITIRMLATEPDTTEFLSDANAVTPNVLVGYYNENTDFVQLYVVDETGRRYIRVS